MFIRNAWYVAAWDFEILANTILERRILDESIVFHRTLDGTPVALQNRCCHRWAPLSVGRKEGDCIRCMYHGMKFGPDGVCVEIPGQSNIPPEARVKTFPVVQRKRWLWIWMGDPAKANPALIPDTFSLQHPAWRFKPGYKSIRANMLNVADNLLDFSHLSFVHEKTLGGSPQIAEARPEISMVADGMRVVRRVNDTIPAPYHQRLGKFTGKVNRWFDYTLSFSGAFLMLAGVQSVDKAENDLDGALLFHSCQAITPETATSTHYFFAQAHGFALDDATITESIYQSIDTAFEEDRRVLEAQQRVIETNPGEKMIFIAGDIALARYRRHVADIVAAETAAGVHA
ncbi:MAG TPA: aromatic ring-hydroxylating dioxygenase subunit alpha [Magnetospirillaceae bacterium]